MSRKIFLHITLVGCEICFGLAGCAGTAPVVEKTVAEQSEILHRQEAELLNQRQQLNEIKRQEIQNESFQRYQRRSEDKFSTE